MTSRPLPAPKSVLIATLVILLASTFPQNTSAAYDSTRLPGNFAALSQLDLVANIETMGVTVSGTNLPKSAELTYRRSGETAWRMGHPLVRIKDGRLVGSLFGLFPSTSYEVKVSDGVNEISATATTQPNELQFTPSTVIHVDDDAAPGGDGSPAAPFKTIQEGVNCAGPGTQVLVADGTYKESVSFPASGSPGNWIQVKAKGNGAILDGAEELTGNIWEPDTRSKVWFTKLERSIGYLARDGQRFYNYADRSGLNQARGLGNVTINEGWYYEVTTKRLYIRSLDEPSKHTWQVPYINHAFDILERDWIWIEGFEMRFYGTSTNGCGVCALNASHVVIRRNKIHNLQLGIFVSWTGGDDRGNDTRIESNEIYDPLVNDWPWDAVKSSSMENTAIIVRGHFGAIVRDNEIHHYFNGIYTGSSAALANPGVAFDADIYNNYIHHISDDALEPEGTCVNHRFRNNKIDRMLIGVSLAPVTFGPTWVLHSTFSNYTGSSFKWATGSDGIVLIYHNTSWTNQPGLNAMSMIHPVHNSVMRNNIFRGNGYAFEEAFTGSTGHDWNYDNWYTTRAGSPRFKWENMDYASMSQLCAATSLECNGHENAPGLSNPQGGDFTLLPTSPNIDKGIPIPGINDNFTGGAPDLGAFEYALDLPPVVVSVLWASANPTNAASVDFTVTFSEPVTGVDLLAPYPDFTLTTSPEISGAAITSVAPVSDTTYTVSVNTGTGNGSLRLDVLDDNSILDAAGNPLGGTAAGDGNFSTGEAYTIDKSAPPAPNVTGSLRADPNPTSARQVNFSVTFSEPVSGVDAGDFAPTMAGNLSGAFVAAVNGSGNAYTVTVNTGSGDGTLRLDLLDDDSILNAKGVQLGGTGVGNGSFASGESYAVDKTAPVVTSILRTDPSPTTASNVNYIVVFTEAVFGVDLSDFGLTTTGEISGASLMNFSGTGSTYTITVGTGNGNGTLRLDLLDNDSILDAAGNPLGGAGLGNGSFTLAEQYTINKVPVDKIVETFRSNGTYDGWILESSEDSNRGGSKNTKAADFYLGDDAQDRQYRAILHFPTASLPDNAVITRVLLMIKGAGLVGTDPFTTHQNILVDIRSGAFGFIGPFRYKGLQASDFQSKANLDAVGIIQNNPFNGWYWAWLDGSAFQYINLYGNTQIRLRFALDDNDDRGNDYLVFYSGDFNRLPDRPQLAVEYYVP